MALESVDYNVVLEELQDLVLVEEGYQHEVEWKVQKKCEEKSSVHRVTRRVLTHQIQSRPHLTSMFDGQYLLRR